MANQKNTEKTPSFLCNICDFKCCRRAEYKRHIETIKHKMLTDANKKTPENEIIIFNCICGNTYNHKSSFSRHKRTCIQVNTSIETNEPVLEIKETEMYKQMHEQIDSKTDKELKELVKDFFE
jgi:hypothetical protein